MEYTTFEFDLIKDFSRVISRTTLDWDHIDATSPQPLANMLCSPLASILLFPFLASALVNEQAVMSEAPANLSHSTQTLADFLTIEPSASIFYDYARGTDLGNKLSDKSSMITVLVPNNKAVMKLAKKPHQDRVRMHEDVVLTEEEMYTRSQKNVERWIAAHMIPTYPIDFNSQSYPTLLDGSFVRFDVVKGDPNIPEWSNVLVNKDMRIVGSKEASNGVYYLIDGVVETD